MELLPKHKRKEAEGGAFLLRGPWKCGSEVRIGPRVGGTLADLPLLAAFLMERPLGYTSLARNKGGWLVKVDGKVCDWGRDHARPITRGMKITFTKSGEALSLRDGRSYAEAAVGLPPAPSGARDSAPRAPESKAVPAPALQSVRPQGPVRADQQGKEPSPDAGGQPPRPIGPLRLSGTKRASRSPKLRTAPIPRKVVRMRPLGLEVTLPCTAGCGLEGPPGEPWTPPWEGSSPRRNHDASVAPPKW